MKNVYKIKNLTIRSSKMKEINWKALSLSLIISTILNGLALVILFFQYVNTISSLFHEILSHLNNSNTSGQVVYTIAQSKSLISLWIGVLIFSLSYVGVTMFSYYLLRSWNR